MRKLTLSIYLYRIMQKQEKVLIRGLVRCAGWIFLIWGILVTCKGIGDSFWGEPEANYFSSEKWEFVTKIQWLRYAGFETVYGLACIGVAYLLWKYASYMPEYYTRPAQEKDDAF